MLRLKIAKPPDSLKLNALPSDPTGGKAPSPNIVRVTDGRTSPLNSFTIVKQEILDTTVGTIAMSLSTVVQSLGYFKKEGC